MMMKFLTISLFLLSFSSPAFSVTPSFFLYNPRESLDVQLASLLRRCLSTNTVTHINLQNSPIQDQQVWVLLNHCPEVDVLNLHGTQVSREVLEAFRRTIKIRRLFLSPNLFSEGVVEGITRDASWSGVFLSIQDGYLELYRQEERAFSNLEEITAAAAYTQDSMPPDYTPQLRRSDAFLDRSTQRAADFERFLIYRNLELRVLPESFDAPSMFPPAH